MKKTFTFLILFTVLNIFSQEQKQGDRNGTLFYSMVDRTEKEYNISIDLFELGDAKYIEAEFYNENDERLVYKLFEIIFKGNTYFIKEEGALEKEMLLYDIHFNIENPDNTLSYPKIRINILNLGYQRIDFSQKVFY